MKKLYRKGTVHPSPPLISDHLSFLPAAILTLAAALSQEDKEVLAYLISCSSGEFSGNRRTTHKSNNTTNPPAPASNPAAGELSGEFSGNRRNTHLKSATSNSGSDNPGGGGGGGGGPKGAASAAAHGGADHLSSFNCYCFSCYMSYWVKWDSSPNRQLIHEILDAYEDGLQSKKEKSKKERRNKNGSSLKQNGSSMNKNGSKDDAGSSADLKKSSSESSLNKKGSGSGSGFGSGQTDPVEETSGSHGGNGDEEEIGLVEKGSVRKFVSFLGERIWSVWT